MFCLYLSDHIYVLPRNIEFAWMHLFHKGEEIFVRKFYRPRAINYVLIWQYTTTGVETNTVVKINYLTTVQATTKDPCHNVLEIIILHNIQRNVRWSIWYHNDEAINWLMVWSSSLYTMDRMWQLSLLLLILHAVELLGWRCQNLV